MVQYRRNFVAGGSFFFTAALADRQARHLVDHAGSLRDAFRTCRRERPFTVDAIVVLPDHLHVIWTLPVDDADFSGRWRRIKSLFSRKVASVDPGVRPDASGEYRLWQRRFWEHTIRDDQDFERHADYIHFNPVKHGLVARVRDWPLSSFHRFVREGILPVDWGGDVSCSEGAFGEPR
jgi:putative transposase